jgi:3-methyl-2-oxobutanoate hydroxymethyltransferase
MVADSSEYKIQGKDENSAELILSDALLLESLGISSLVLECIPSALAKEVSSKLNIPTIGIGAGKDCDGQVLVCYDMLGITQGKLPRFVRNFVSTEGTIPLAISAFVKEVKAGTFPSTSESY